MIHKTDTKSRETEYANIGFYGRPISALSKAELLAAFAELVDLYIACKHKSNRCKEVLGENKFESL